MHALSLLIAPVLVSAAAISSRSSPRAAYFLDNNPAGSSIVSLQIADDGTLSYPVRTPTGGKGLLALTAGTNGAAPAAGGAGKVDELPLVEQSNIHQIHSLLKTLYWFLKMLVPLG
jgi:hypothetical protein